MIKQTFIVIDFGLIDRKSYGMTIIRKLFSFDPPDRNWDGVSRPIDKCQRAYYRLTFITFIVNRKEM